MVFVSKMNEEIQKLILSLKEEIRFLKEENQRLKANNDQLNLIANSLPVLIAYIDRDLKYQFLNEYYSTIHGVNIKEIIGKSVKDVLSEEGLKIERPKFEAALRGEKIKNEDFFITRTGRPHHYIVELIPHIEEGIVKGFITLVLDITERKEMEERFKELSETDPLTGVKNRRYFTGRIIEEFERAKRYGSNFAVLIIDIDLFKKLNDTYGHDVGDKVLKEMTQKVSLIMRKSDILCRMGGDEFILILTETNFSQAQLFKKRLLNMIGKAHVEVYGERLKFNITVGVGEYVKGDESFENILKRADNELYIEKKKKKMKE